VGAVTRFKTREEFTRAIPRGNLDSYHEKYAPKQIDANMRSFPEQRAIVINSKIRTQVTLATYYSRRSPTPLLLYVWCRNNPRHTRMRCLACRRAYTDRLSRSCSIGETDAAAAVKAKSSPRKSKFPALDDSCLSVLRVNRGEG
jgi:hypothetical protein